MTAHNEDDTPPSIPLVDVPRDSKGVINEGRRLAIGNTPGVFGEFFVAPAGRVNRDARTYPRSPEGWLQAWNDFRQGDPAAAESYRVALARRAVTVSARQHSAALREVFPQMHPDALAASAFAVVPSCALVTGYGTKQLSTQVDSTLYFMYESLIVGRAKSSDQLFTAPLADILTLRADGPGAQTTGGGFIGGGSGLVGAAEGMLMASALNAITRRTSVQTFIEVHVYGRHLLWVTDKITPSELQLLLRPIYARMHELQMAKEAANIDPLDRLQKLGALRDSGVLTEAEFAIGKARLLADLSEQPGADI